MALFIRRKPLRSEAVQELDIKAAHGDVQGVVSSFRAMQQQSQGKILPPDAYIATIRALSRSGDLVLAQKFLREMLQAKVFPPAELLNQVLEAMGRGNQAAEVPTLLREIESLSPGCADISVYNAAMSACLQGNEA
jgi:hypothetical protein